MSIHHFHLHLKEDARLAAPLLPKSALYSIRGLWQTAHGQGVLFAVKRGVSVEAVKMAGGLSALQRKGRVF